MTDSQKEKLYIAAFFLWLYMMVFHTEAMIAGYDAWGMFLMEVMGLAP